MRLIDADALKEFINNGRVCDICPNKKLNCAIYCDFPDSLTPLLEKVIDNAPTVKPQKIVTIPPELIEKLASCVVNIVGNIDWEKAIEAYKARPHGEWTSEGFDEWYECSNCFKGDTYFDGLPNFCPNCGADMRGGRE